MINTPSYMKVYKAPKTTKQPSERRVWSIGLETVLVPFYTAGNAQGDTAISPEALGAPLRLGYDKTGAVRFTPSGRPVIRVAKEITDAVRLIREDLIASMVNYSGEVIRDNADGYKAQLELNRKLGDPIKVHDERQRDLALKAIADKVAAEAVAEAPEAVTKAVMQAEAVAEAHRPEAPEAVKSNKGRKRELVTA